ncbi:DoxX family protein [Xanthomonas hortorum]|uniref:DoxX family protein n=1 Tax=Xanthomonas hortorum TaxID=56454 RepID=UPI0020CC5BE5|nr:DoxX family protein [Xanthomonas hortorum]
MTKTQFMAGSLPRVERTVSLILRISLAAAFLYYAGLKLIGAPAMVGAFDKIGLGQWLRYATGLVELSGALLLLPRRFAIAGAALLLLTMIGASVTHVMRLDGAVPISALLYGIGAFAILLLERRDIGALYRRMITHNNGELK